MGTDILAPLSLSSQDAKVELRSLRQLRRAIRLDPTLHRDRQAPETPEQSEHREVN
jgi:hypothetical protein